MVGGTRRTALALTLGAVAMLGACKKGNEAADTTAAAMAPADTGMAANTTAAAAPAAALTDAQIFGMVVAANSGEVAAGKIAETKATSAQVKSFAHDMVVDHGEMLSDATALARKLSITPDAAAADSISSANSAFASALTSAPKGATFDSTYVNGQVAGHQATLDMVKRAEGQAKNADLKSALTSAEGVVQKHLDRIRDIQGKTK